MPATRVTSWTTSLMMPIITTERPQWTRNRSTSPGRIILWKCERSRVQGFKGPRVKWKDDKLRKGVAAGSVQKNRSAEVRKRKDSSGFCSRSFSCVNSLKIVGIENTTKNCETLDKLRWTLRGFEGQVKKLIKTYSCFYSEETLGIFSKLRQIINNSRRSFSVRPGLLPWPAQWRQQAASSDNRITLAFIFDGINNFRERSYCFGCVDCFSIIDLLNIW